jgi:pimeloyl-ACP methyl ester carboxylesterase
MGTSFINSIDGAKIAYKKFGQGDLLLLVHGMGSNKEMWEENGWIESFKSNFTVVTMDIRGSGESDKAYSSEFYSINNIINDIECIVKECGFKEFYYFGHSYGATIGLQLCKKSKAVKRIICGGTTLGNKFFKEIVPEWIKEHENIGEKKKNNAIGELNPSIEELEWIERTDFDLMLAQFKAWTGWEGVEAYEIKTRLAMYSGTEDYEHIIDNLRENQSKIKCNKSIIKIFEELNHTGLVSRIDKVAPWVMEFLIEEEII